MELYSAKSYHRPIHYFFDDTYYFLTVRLNERVISTNKKKSLVNFVINKASKIFEIKIHAWVILDNHFHLLFLLDTGTKLSKLLHNLNANISRLINLHDNKQDRKLINNYWDYCIRDERDYYTHLNYIHHNPVKHGYCKNQQEVKDYKFCSYEKWLKNKGEEWVLSCFEEYPIIDFTIEED